MKIGQTVLIKFDVKSTLGGWEDLFLIFSKSIKCELGI